jgi:hypothetical protein
LLLPGKNRRAELQNQGKSFPDSHPHAAVGQRARIISSREGVALANPRKPRSVGPKTQICCLTGKQTWTAPEQGQPCRSKAHGHITYAKVVQLVDEEKMEWVAGIRQVFKAKTSEWVAESCWIPVARFVNARRWKKTPSFDGLSSVATMQLVAGG